MVVKPVLGVCIAAIAGFAAVANAAQVSVSGGIVVPNTGSTSPLGPNANTAITFSGAGSGVTVTGLVQATSSVVNNVQVLTLVLTNFVYTSTSQSAVTIDVNIIQNYAIPFVPNPLLSATGSHQLNGNTTGNRNGNIVVTSTHESTNLPVLNLAFVGPTDPLSAAQGSTTTVSPIDSIYTINTTYRFTIDGGVASGSIILPDSGVDNATLVLIPLPPAAWAGVAGLGLVGLTTGLRRRKMAV